MVISLKFHYFHFAKIKGFLLRRNKKLTLQQVVVFFTLSKFFYDGFYPIKKDCGFSVSLDEFLEK